MVNPVALVSFPSFKGLGCFKQEFGELRVKEQVRFVVLAGVGLGLLNPIPETLNPQCEFFRNLSEYGSGFPRMQWLEKVLHHPVYPEYNMALGFTVRNYQN